MEPFRLEKKERKFYWRWFLFFLLFGLVLMAIFYFFLYADFLKVKEVKVIGLRSLPERNFVTLLESEIIAEDRWRAFFGSENIIFWLAVSEKIAERLPALSALQIKTDLLSRKVNLLAEERRLAGLWCLPARGCFVFDEKGIAFSRAPLAEGGLILKVTDESGREIQVGEKLLPEPVWFENFMSVLKDLKEAKWIIAAVRVKDLALREWEVVSEAGPVFQFNFDVVPIDFRSVLVNLKKELDLSRLGYVDFRVPNKIYYR